MSDTTPKKQYRNELVCTKTITLLAEVAAYSSFYAPSDYPITKVLREPVYVEVRILARSDPNIILNLEHCWATSNPNPDSLPQWDLLFNGYIKAIRYNFVQFLYFVLRWILLGCRCPYHDDKFLTTVVRVDGSSGLQYPTHHKRFVIKMFTFVDPNDFFPQQDRVQQSLFKLDSLTETVFLTKCTFFFFFFFKKKRCSSTAPQLFAIQPAWTLVSSTVIDSVSILIVV